MLERLKFMFGFFNAYRRERREGLGRDDALHKAAQAMIDAREEKQTKAAGPGRSFLSPEIAELWADPAPAFEGIDPDIDGTWFGHGPFEITEDHIALLRKMRFTWDGAERGAPMLDPERPYGRTDLLDQLAEVFDGDDADTLARRHVEMYFVLARVLTHGVLRPGRYPLHNVNPGDIRNTMRGYGSAQGLSDADLGLDGGGSIEITDEHLKLLRNAQVVWPSHDDCEKRIESGLYPAAAADPKRPYGDFTYIEVDMARILGRLPPRPEGDEAGIFEPDDALARDLQRLHWQMFGAIQVFSENAEIAPGTYDLDVIEQ